MARCDVPCFELHGKLIPIDEIHGTTPVTVDTYDPGMEGLEQFHDVTLHRGDRWSFVVERFFGDIGPALACKRDVERKLAELRRQLDNRPAAE